MQIYTIGFTQKSAKQFFESLKGAGITRLIDVRLNNSSQLSAFSKKNDLEYFLREICGIDYVHEPLLAPTAAMLESYKARKNWNEYAKVFVHLLRERQVEQRVDQKLFAGKPILLCSEPDAANCHRRLVAEYLRAKWVDVEIVHM